MDIFTLSDQIAEQPDMEEKEPPEVVEEAEWGGFASPVSLYPA